jgi:hypothetical protein
MSFLDDAASTLKNVFLGSADTWWERLEADLVLTSPSGTEYKPRYQGQDSFRISKRLGKFNIPMVPGTIIQDLDTDSLAISITFFFDDKNNDTNARAFLLTGCRERGVWTIVHPAHGMFELQLEKAELTNTNDGISEIQTEWFEPIDPETLKTARELAGIVDSQIDALDVGALSQFIADINQANSTVKHIVETTTQGIENVVDYALYPLFGIVGAVDDAMTTVHAGIVDSLNAVAIPLAELGGQIQQLIGYPALATRDLDTRVDCYGALVTGLTELLPGESKTPLKRTSSAIAQINNIVVTELALSASISALARIAMTSDFTTREQALNTADNMIDKFNSIVASLEEKQSLYYSQYIDEQYFSQSSTYVDLAKLVYDTVQYLLRISFDLKIKQIITLDRPTPPIILSAQYYDDFDKLDYFIETNGLKGPEIYLLPAGREVVLYV